MANIKKGDRKVWTFPVDFGGNTDSAEVTVQSVRGDVVIVKVDDGEISTALRWELK